MENISTKNPIKIRPSFNKLTPQGIEMLKDMGNIENAKLWLRDFVTTVDATSSELAFLIALFQAIVDKCDKEDKFDHPADFIDALQRELFLHTIEFGDCINAYTGALKSGNFEVGEIIYPEGEKSKEADQPDERSEDIQTPGKDRALQTLANQVYHVLTSDKVSSEAKDAFISVIFEAGNEVGMATDHPDLIKAALPKIIESHDEEYGKAIYHSISSLLNSRLVSQVKDELKQLEAAEKQSESIPSKESYEKYWQELGKKVTYFLEHDEVSDEIKNAVLNIISHVATEAMYELTYSDEVLKTNLFEILIRHKTDYASAVAHSIQAILDTASTQVQCEMLQFDEQPQQQDKPLDLSNSSVEDLARKLSDIMHDKNLPERVYNCLADELAETFVDTDSPENIALNIKSLLDQENKESGNEQSDR